MGNSLGRNLKITLIIPKNKQSTASSTEVEGYSITPTTYKSRNAFSFTNEDDLLEQLANNAEKKIAALQVEDSEAAAEISAELNSKKVSLEGFKNNLEIFARILKTLPSLVKLSEEYIVYKDIFELENEATYFGIRSTEKLESHINQYNQQIHDLNSGLQQKATSDSSKSKGKASSTSIKSSGSSSSNLSSKKNNPDIIIHPLEAYVISNSIKELKGTDKKAVVVDIFARSDDAKVKFLENGHLETHSIVLYKNDVSEFVIIDPSNSAFSKHLINSCLLLHEDNIRLLAETGTKIKIYEPKKLQGVGPNPNEYRDCIDIALKIAASLNQLEDTIKTKDIKNLTVVKELTNQESVGGKHLESLEDKPTRIKQASNIKIREQFNKKIEFIYKQLQSLKIYPSIKAELISQEYDELHDTLTEIAAADSKNVFYEEIIESLNKQAIKNGDAFKAIIDITGDSV